MINKYKVIRYKNIPSTPKPVVVDYYKYYARSNEVLYRFEEDISHNVKYLHLDYKGRKLFESYGMEFLHDIEDLSAFVDASIDGDKDFCNIFIEMIKSEQDNALLSSHMFELTTYPKPPIIIGGCGRSGTTLLLSIMDAHNNIVSLPGESFAFYPKPFRPGVIAYHISELGINPSQRWCEKTPKHVLAFRDIYELFKGRVKLIHIVRDGRDVVTSVHPTKDNTFWVPIERWIDDTASGLACKDIVYTMKYENLVTDTQQELKKLCDYIEEPFDNNMLNFAEYTHVRRDPGWFDVVKNVHTQRMGKWNDIKFKERVDDFLSNPAAVRIMKELEYL